MFSAAEQAPRYRGDSQEDQAMKPLRPVCPNRRFADPQHATGRLRPRSSLWVVLILLWPTAALLVGCTRDDETAAPVGDCPPEYLGTDEDPRNIAWDIPRSCSFDCGDSPCAEPETPYGCPAMGPWASLPHEAGCGCFDGQLPAVSTGQCSASEPSGEALRKAGPQGGQKWVLPDGHLIEPAGIYATLDEQDLEGTFPMSLVPIDGTSLVLSSDGGIRDNALRLLDVSVLASGADPTVAHVRFAKPSSLFYGVVWLPPDTALASGGGDGILYAFNVDTTQLTLSRDEARDIDLGGPTGSSFGDSRWYSSAVAVTADGTRALIGPSTAAKNIQVRSLETSTWGAELGSVGIPGESIFEIARDPYDPNGTTFYATDWDTNRVLEIDGANIDLTRHLPLGKNPEGIAFINERFMAVASSDTDSLTIIDRVVWEEHTVIEVQELAQPYGHGPTLLAYDDARDRLYATLSGVNAVAVFDVTVAGSTATVTAAGRIPTAWWPTAINVQDDGSLVVLAGKGTGTGPDTGFYEWSGGPITRLMHGGVQYVAVPSATELDTMTSTAEQARKLASTAGYPTVSCPSETYDFPVPESPEQGPSEQIKNVVFIIRENKTYDAVFGDLPGTDGDPSLVLAPGLTEQIWPNSRKLAQAYTNFDNFYTDAEQSVQGHIWTAFGRTTDFIERAWLTAWGRGTRAPMAGISDMGKPEEGSIFDVLDRAGVAYANMGEIIGVGQTPADPHYPGLFTAIGKPDTEKACYIAARARVLCDLPPLTYAVMPNDHTFGGDANSPHPGVMIAVNDEATGMVVDALSHSPLWPSTLVIITEDDPQDGGDHVDVHRTLLFMASPWVKRGYLSKGHYDMASVLKLIVTILGVSYPNEQVAQAPLPYDAFTATPDYTPYDYVPRKYGQPCNPAGTEAAAEAKNWDFSEIDDQPGIGRWVWRILHDRRYDRPKPNHQVNPPQDR